MMLIFFPPESYGFFLFRCVRSKSLYGIQLQIKRLFFFIHAVTVVALTASVCDSRSNYPLVYIYVCSAVVNRQLCIIISTSLFLVCQRLNSVSRLLTIFCLFAEFIGRFILKQIKRCVERDETGTIEKCYRNNKKVVQKVGRCKNYEIIIRNESSYPYTLFRFICFSLGVISFGGSFNIFCLVFVCILVAYALEAI